MKDAFTFVSGNLVKTLPLECEESTVMKEAGKMLLQADIPGVLEIISNAHGTARFSIGKRGKYKKDGKEMPSMYVTCNFYSLDLASSEYADAYLTCVNLESNNYKFYRLRPNNSCGRTTSIGATYGRIGSERGEAFGEKDLQTPYEPYLYWIRYYEKLSKGYVDQTDIYLNSEPVKPAPQDDQEQNEEEENGPAQELFDTLLLYAKGVVEENLKSPATVTQKQVEEGWKLWKELGGAASVDDFNQRLSKLIALSPRKCRYVTELLALSSKDYAKIIDREESLLNAMSVVAGRPVHKKKSKSGFRDFGIKVYLATEAQEAKVREKLPDELRQKVKHVYRVISEKQKERFNAYLKNNGIKTVKEFWHGSRNENWLNIMKCGLLLHPNAILTGKMLGDAAYVAPSALKALGYTSWKGSYWAHGTCKTAFMGLFATAYGNPWMITQTRRFTAQELKAAHKNCVHARSGISMGFTKLKNDEVAFYDEAALLLNFIVEFGE